MQGEHETFQGEVIYPPLHFWAEGTFKGEGGGLYILKLPAAGFSYAPPFYTPPTPRRVFSGVGGGLYKIWPPMNFQRCNLKITPQNIFELLG